MTRVDRIKKLIDLGKVQSFITGARDAADAVEAVYNSSMPDDDKLVGVFDACVKLGLYDETDLPE